MNNGSDVNSETAIIVFRFLVHFSVEVRILKSDIAFVLKHSNTSLVFRLTRERPAFSCISLWKKAYCIGLQPIGECEAARKHVLASF